MHAKKQKKTEIKELGEFGLIDRLTKGFTAKNPNTIKAVGDDAAIIDNGEYLTVISTDLLIEGIHFDLMYTPLKHLGYKAVIANLSDIYAMNAIPNQITVSIAVSSKYYVEALEEIYSGIQAACNHYHVDLIGGDTSSSGKGLILSVTAIGQGKPDRITYRSGASVGDILCITGDLGAAYVGLQILEREKQIFLSQPGVQPDLEEQSYVIGRQLKPEARKDMIDIFHRTKLVPTSMIDVSDGLASDLLHICNQSGLGAYIEETGVPIHPQTQLMAIKFNMDPITCALSGGEDYELLFTISPKDLPRVRLLPDIYIMGEMVDEKEGINLHTKEGKLHPITAQGWLHFK